jgi:hypothetical protein
MGPVGRIRQPIVVVLLSIITIGIYQLYYQYAMFKEMKDYSGRGIGGGVGLVIAIFVSPVNLFLMPNEVGNLYKAEGQLPPVTAIVGLWNLIPLIGTLIWLWKVQGAMNSFWMAHGAVPA